MKELKSKTKLKFILMICFIVSILILGKNLTVNAAIIGGTIDFNNGTTDAVVPNQNGLDFLSNLSEWKYDTSGSYGPTTNAYPQFDWSSYTGYGILSTPAVIKVVRAGDTFDIASLDICNGADNTSITFVGYAGGTEKCRLVVNNTNSAITQYMYSYINVALGFNKIDELMIYGNVDGCFNIDNLVINPDVSITTQPSNKTVKSGSSASFNLSATPDGTNEVVYQWQVDNGSGNFTNISNVGCYSGATASTLSISSTTSAMSGYKYRALVNGIASNSATLTVNSDVAPTATTTAGTTSFSENGSPVIIDSGLTVSDSDNTTLASAKVSITGNFQSDQDTLNFTNNGSAMGNIDGTYNKSTGILTLTSPDASATLAQWKTALSSITYSNTSDNPNISDRTISFVVNDGEKYSTAATRTVSIAVPTARPIANPVGGVVDSGTLVSLSSATVGADIYYTTNGNTPTISSTHYTAPITVSSAETIKAIAVKSGIIDSDVMSESYTIKTYDIKAQSTDLALGTVGAGGTYAKGETATLTAVPRMGIKFVKWTSDAEGNTVISTDKSMNITVNDSSTCYAWFTPETYTLEVVNSNPTAGTVIGVKQEGYSYNEQAALTAAANIGYAFVGWKNEYGVTVSISPTLSFNVSGNMTITPIFTQVATNKTYYTADFYHQSGNLLESEKIEANSTVTPPNTPSKAGYDFIGWSIDGINPIGLNQDGSITITSNMIFRPLFKVKEIKYSLTVNGIQSIYSPLSNVTAQVAQADIPLDKKFSYWKDEAGNIVSYSNPYNFSITGNTTLIAVYEDSSKDVIKKPTLTLSAPTYELVSTGKHKMIWYAAMDLPEGYTLVESGILRIVSTTPQTNEQMTFDANGIYRRVIQVSSSIPNQYYYSVTSSDGKGVSVRAYIVVRNKDGNLETIFSDVQYGYYGIA